MLMLKLKMVMLVSATLMTTTSAFAQSQDVERCVDSNNQFSFDVRIAGCTGMISSGRHRGKTLAAAYDNRGASYAEKKDYNRAIADHTEAIRLDPTPSTSYYNRGWAYWQKKDFARAIKDLTKAIELPTAPVAYSSKAGELKTNQMRSDYFSTRGRAYRDKGDKASAITDFREGLRLDPGNKDILNDLSALSATP